MSRGNAGEWAQLAQLVESVATTAGIIVGGWWAWKSYVRERLNQPKLNIKQSIDTVRISPRQYLVQVCATIENVGSIKVELGKWDLRIERILPVENGVPPEAEARVPSSQLPWPLIADREHHDLAVYLDPGEQDDLVADVLVPGDAEVIRVYSHFQPRPALREQAGWSKQSVVDLQGNAREWDDEQAVGTS